MAKGQKRSNRETRKPKQEKPKPAEVIRVTSGAGGKGVGDINAKGPGR